MLYYPIPFFQHYFLCILEQNFFDKRLKTKEHYSYTLQSTPKTRPTGVTIIAILNIIGGIIMLFGAIALIAIGAILPTLPPSVFNQSQLQGNLTAGQAPVPADVPMVSQSLIGGIGIAFGVVTVCYIYCLICCSLRATERSRMGVDRYCDLIHYQHRIKCNFNCYWQYSRDY